MIEVIAEQSIFFQLNASIKETLSALERFEWQAIEDLRRMQKDKLYKEVGHKNFEEYCDGELCQWGGYRRVKQLLGAKKVVDLAGEFGSAIKNERQARPLLKLVKEPEKLKQAIAITLAENPNPSESDFASAAKELEIIPQTGKIKKEPVVPFSPETPGNPKNRLTKINRNWTQAEVEELKAFMRANFQLEMESLEKDIRNAETAAAREVAEAAVQEQMQANQVLTQRLREENIALQQKVDELEALRQLEVENQKLQERVQDLEKALAQQPAQDWGQTFNKQAVKALNQEVKQALERLDPDLHLKIVAASPPPSERIPEVVQLLSSTIDKLLPIALKEYKESLDSAQSWQEFEPVTLKWLGIKFAIWGKLSPEEKSKVKALKELSPPKLGSESATDPTSLFVVGAQVSHTDIYIAASNFHGTIEQVFPSSGEAIVRWQERAGKPNQCERYFLSELRILEEAA